MTGTVATFYSYKGGVGRSFLLANTATLLARWGYRVLCVDWDIEAPGLDEYFRPWLGTRERPGLIDLVTGLARGRPGDWRTHVSELSLPGCERPLHLMTAGAPGSGLATRIQAINWRELYDDHQFGAYVEAMRSQWTETYDLVLVDSRTGITDIGGICTVHLPDILVVVFTANQQSVSGIKQVVQMAESQRDRLPLNRAGLLTLPVLARFDARGQDELAKDWLRRIALDLEAMYDGWLDADVSPRQFLDASRVPYFSVWTFGERLAALEERDADPEYITYHVATIAALLARRLEDAGQLCRNRDAYVQIARDRPGLVARDGAGAAFEHDYYLSYASSDVEFALAVATELRASGARVFLDADAVRRAGSFRDALENAAARCRDFVVLRSAPTLSRWQQYELLSFAEVADAERTIFDVELVLGLPALNTLLASVQHSHRIDGSRRVPRQIIDQIRTDHARDAGDAPIDDHLHDLAERYLNTWLDDYAERLRVKDRLASEMGRHVVAQRTSRDELAREGHDGLAVALAEAVLVAAQPGDLSRLLAAASAVLSLHAAFRILVAVGSILENERVSDTQRAQIQELCTQYQHKASARGDEPLVALVETTQRRLKNLT